MIVMREAVHVADLDLLGEEVGDEPQLPEPESDLDRGRPATPACRRERRAIAGSPAIVSGDDRREDQRAETDESGPSTRTRDGPNSAYPTRQAIVV